MSTKERMQAVVEAVAEENLDELYEMVRDFAETHNGAKKPGIMEKLRSVKIDGPPDFAEKLDEYMNNDLHAEYDTPLIRSGVRGKYAKRYHEGTNLVLLAPDVAAAFPDAKAVNDALRLLLAVAKKATSNGKVAV